MRIKGFMLLLVASLILITFKTYAPKVNNVIDEGRDSLIHETQDIEEEEAIFTYSPLSEEVTERITGISYNIEKIRIIDEYDAKDELSMLDNNSSAFCYREIEGSNGKLSNHSYGIAIDINPIQNPYVKNNLVLPESGKEYLDRSNFRKGMIVEGDSCYNAFKNRGWTWGGDWNSLKDYQHFEFKLNE